MRRAAFVALLGSAAALGSVAAAPRAVHAQTLVPLRVATPGGDTYAEPFYALDAGFFAKAGFDGQLTVLNNAGAVTAAVAGGSVDVGIGDMIGIANAVNHGIPLQVFAGAGMYSSSSATTFLCVEGTSPVRAAKDLEGKTVAVVTLVGLGTSATKAWLTQNGADLTKIKFLELPQSEMPPALQRDLVQAAVIVEPFFTSVRSQIRVLGKPYDAVGKEFLICQWIATTDWLAKNAASARKLVGAIYETARWANTHHDESLPILAKYNKLDPERMRGIVRAAYATRVDVGLIQPVVDVGVRYKTIEKALDAGTIIAKL
jgi:NitT/TauT family transport system substrate-binding protein